MSAPAPAPVATIGTGRQAADLWCRYRVPVGIGVLVVLIGLVTAVAGRTSHDLLDPRSPAKGGSQALAVLLRERGVMIERVPAVTGLAERHTVPVTVFVPFPERLGADGLDALATLGAEHLVLLDPPGEVLARLDPGVQRAGTTASGPREPACDLPEAVRAGVADTGGATYRTDAAPAGSCYAAGGAGSLVVRDRPGGHTVVVMGDGTAFTNARLGERGNAALALGLLGRTDRLLWLLPPPGVPLAPAGTDHPVALRTLLPRRLLLALGQLAVAVVLIGLWRARRFGPVVAESLPVIVRAAEAVEGRGRLYRSARSREQTADALRSGTRHRLLPGLGLPPDAQAAAVVASVADRAGRPAGQVAGLLYGAPPGDDAALVALAGALDALDREVRRS